MKSRESEKVDLFHKGTDFVDLLGASAVALLMSVLTFWFFCCSTSTILKGISLCLKCIGRHPTCFPSGLFVVIFSLKLVLGFMFTLYQKVSDVVFIVVSKNMNILYCSPNR